MTLQSGLTGLAACLFVAVVTLLFVVLYHETMRTGPLLWIAGLLLVGACVCWVARVRTKDPGSA